MYYEAAQKLILRDPANQELVNRDGKYVDFLQSRATQRITILSETVQHWAPQVLQFVIKNKIGQLNYPMESNESRVKYQSTDIA